MKFRMTKIIALVLALALLIGSGACLQSFALEDDFDSVIEETYSPTIQKLLRGEEVEFLYNGKPMTYDLSVIAEMAEAKRASGNNSLDSAEFESTRDDTAPTHQRICANALAIILHDKGTSQFDDSFTYYDTKNGITCHTYADFIVYHSASPDEDETGLYVGTDEETGKNVYKKPDSELSITNPFNGMTYFESMFSGHFYDPYTEKNFKNRTADTCKINARRHYDTAITFYNAGRIADAFEELGRGCHYVQDACQTHHANNLTAAADGAQEGLSGKNRHALFEKDVDTYIRNHMPYANKLNDLSNDVFDSSIYNEALRLSVENIVRNNDYSSYVLLDKSDYRYATPSNITDSSSIDYYDSVTAEYKNATMATTQYIWHFAKEVGIF